MVSIKSVALLSGLLACSGALVAAPGVDLVVVNGSVYTADAGQREAQAFAVRGDTIAAVGSNEAILALAGQSTRVLDVGGRRVLLYHHRGQFGVYLRLLGAKVPSAYGPSGDELPDFMAG
jgi:hypothetical protein